MINRGTFYSHNFHPPKRKNLQVSQPLLHPILKISMPAFELILKRIDNFRHNLTEERDPEVFLACVKFVASSSGVNFEDLRKALGV